MSSESRAGGWLRRMLRRTMRVRTVTCLISAAALVATACASAPGEAGADGEGDRLRTSTASMEGGGASTSPVISVQAGTVRVTHAVFGSARLSNTILEGVDDETRHLTYSWSRDGEHTVEVSGRYRHRVAGAVVGTDRRSRLTSRLSYVPHEAGSRDD